MVGCRVNEEELAPPRPEYQMDRAVGGDCVRGLLRLLVVLDGSIEEMGGRGGGDSTSEVVRRDRVAGKSIVDGKYASYRSVLILAPSKGPGLLSAVP